MVSFFGLKFGADKKKKETEGKKAPQEWKRIDQNALGEGQFFGRDIHRKGVVNGSIRSVSRPGTSHSTRGGTSPYAMQTHNFAASSMYDLSNLDRGRKGSLGSLKPFASDANLRTRFNNASSTSLAAPPLPMPAYGAGSRPGTPNSTRNKAWVNPLDVHFSRPTTPAMPQTPKSPLGQFEFGVSEKAETSSLFGDSPEKVAEEISARIALDQERARAKAEMEARAKAQAELEAQARKHAEAASPPTSPPMSIPSPPASMKREPGPIIIGPGPAPRFQGPAANDERPPSRGRDRPNGGAPGPRGPGSRHGSRPRDPREREPRGPKHHAGPHGLPSPPLSQGTRFSEEKASRPIIQNVRAKRDTLTISGAKRKSLEMEIDEFEKSLVKAQEGRKGSSGSSHYSEGIDDRTLGEPMLPPLAPPPLQEQRKPSPQFAQPQRTQSPMGRAPPVRGPTAPRRPNPDEYGASFRRAESPMGRGPTGRPPRPAPEEYGVPIHGRSESPMGPPPMARQARPESPMGRPAINGPQRTQSPMGRAPIGREPRPQSPMGRPPQINPGPRAESPMGRPRMNPGPRPESPMGRPQMSAGKRPESPMGRPRMNPGPRPESPMGRPPQMNHARRPESPMGRPRMNPGPRPESPMGRPQMNMGPRPESPMGRPQMPAAARPESPRGRPQMSAARRPESPMGRPRMNNGPRPESPMGHSRMLNSPRPESPAPARNSPRAADFQSDSHHPPARKNTPPEFRQPNWNPPAPAPQTELRREDFSAPPQPQVVAAPARDDPNWPLPSPTVMSSPIMPSRPKRGPPPPINIAATLYADDMSRGPFTPPVGSGGHHLMSPVEDRRPHTAGLPGSEDGIGMARGPSVRGDHFDSRRPNYGLRSPTGIADEYGTGFI